MMLDGLIEANRERTERAAKRTVAEAQAALNDATLTLTGRQLRVLHARVRHPHAPLTFLAAYLGMTKDAYGSCLRRTLAEVRRDV